MYPPGWLLLSSMTAWAGGMEVLSEPAGSGSVRKQVIRDDASVVLLFGGEQRGSLDTCGCPRWPRGGLPRIEGYRAVGNVQLTLDYSLDWPDKTEDPGEQWKEIVLEITSGDTVLGTTKIPELTATWEETKTFSVPLGTLAVQGDPVALRLAAVPQVDWGIQFDRIRLSTLP